MSKRISITAAGERLRRQIDVQFEGLTLGLGEQRRHRVFRQRDQQQSVLLRVGEKNVREARRDHATKAVFEQRPHRMLALDPQPKLLRASRMLPSA